MTAPPTMRLTKAVMLRTRRVSKKVNRFLFVGRMEKNVLQRAMQHKLETRIAIAQVAQLKIILGRLLSTDSRLSWHLFSPASFGSSAMLVLWSTLICMN